MMFFSYALSFNYAVLFLFIGSTILVICEQILGSSNFSVGSMTALLSF